MVGVAQLVTCLPVGREHKIVKQYCVYALKSEKDGRLYIGMSCDVESRLKEHNCGRVRSTRTRRPFKIAYTEVVGDRKAARVREKFLKSGCGREFLKHRLRDGGCSSVG